jgi:molybdopterin-binding protein
MPDKPDKAEATLHGTVEKVVKSRYPGECEKAEIAVEGADHLYKEIRIENTLTQKSGHEVHLKAGAEVEVTIKAGPQAFRSEE